MTPTEGSLESGTYTVPNIPPKVAEPPELEHGIKHVRRVVSESGLPTDVADPLPDIERYINMYLNEGWKIQQVFYMGRIPEGLDFFWVLVK